MNTRALVQASIVAAVILGCEGPPTSAPAPAKSVDVEEKPPAESTSAESTSGAMPPPAHETRLEFDDVPIGTLPASWSVAETNPDGPIAVWRVTPEGGARSGRCVLLLAEKLAASERTFNLCWSSSLRMRDGAIEVALQARTGKIDRGGGVVWRVKDARNYYVCRFNPLENNVRAYFVREGARTQIATADVLVDSKAWHTIRVETSRSHVTCSLDGTKLLEFDDATFPDDGGVGVWTKSDAATAFDDFVVHTH